MTKFKVGDRVRVIDNKLIECCVNIGEIGVVLQENHPNYLVDFPERGNRWWLESDRIELVSPVPYFEFTFDEDVYTFSRKESVTFVKRGYHKRYTYYGFAVCNSPDKFDKLAGMQKALDRVLANWSEEGKAKAQKALLDAWEESQKKPETQQQVGNYIIHINLKRNPVVVSWTLPIRGALIKGFVADNHLFLESEGWKDPKKEMPEILPVISPNIEFRYRNDSRIYIGGPDPFSNKPIFWTDKCGQSGETDIARSPDVIAWRHINRAEPDKNIGKKETDSAKSVDPVETFKRAVDEFVKATKKNM